jgi:hypothetical protein
MAGFLAGVRLATASAPVAAGSASIEGLRRHVFVLAFVVLAVVGTASRANAQAKVSGEVLARGGQPLSAASIAVSDPSGRVLTGALTDERGRFVITNLPPGRYDVRVSHDGFQPDKRELIIGVRNTVYSLSHIALDPVATVQELVVQAAPATRVAVGTSSFDMDDNIAARSGGSVLDALRTLPGITISDEGGVMLRGSDRVPVLVDGKPSALTGFGNQTALDSIPAGNIDRIEIITNPSARFDAAGMAGIVNIVYKTNRKLGLHGDVGLSYGVGTLEKRKADVPSPLGSFTHNPRVAPSLNLTYNADDWSGFGSAEYIDRKDLPNNEFTTRYYDDARIRYSQIPENRRQTRVIAKAGFDWRPTEANSFTVAVLYDREHHIDRAQIPFLDQNLSQLRYWFWRESEITGLFNIGATWKHQLGGEPGHTLGLNVQFSRAWEDETYNLNEVSPVRVGTDQTRIVAIEKTLPVSLDYVRPLSSGRLEAGLKYQRRHIPDTYDVVRGNGSIIYPGLGDTSEWGETIYAGYLNLVYERPNWAVEGGVRGEKTKVFYTLDPANIYYPRSDRYNYAKLFFNTRFTYNLSDKTQASVFYNNRVDRPGEAELRVFPKYDDPELLKVGNPYLRPQFTRTYEARVQHSFGRHSVQVSAYRRHITDPFTRVYAIDPTNTTYEIINKIFANTGRASHHGLEALSTVRFDHVTLSGSLNWYRNKLSAFDIPVFFPVPRTIHLDASKGTTWDGKLNATAQGPWGVQLQATATYYAARNIAQGRASARSSVDLALSRKFRANRLEVVLAGTDIFNKFGVEHEIRGDGFTAIYQNFYQTQAVTLSAKHAF